MTYRLISSQFTIAKIYRDLQYKDGTQIAAFIEWIGEAMEHINVFPALERVQEELEVTDGVAELPASLAKIIQIAEKQPGGLVPLKYLSASFPREIHTEDSPSRAAYNAQHGYVINNNYIETDLDEGTLAISYVRYPVDEEGFPKVPDNISFHEACKWYVALRLSEGGWKHPAGFNYMQIEERWHHYCGQARQKAMMPDEAGYQKILDMWVNLTPNYHWYNEKFEMQPGIVSNARYGPGEPNITPEDPNA